MSRVAPLAVGAELPPFVVARVESGPMKTVAVLLEDPNAIHWDTAVTRELGLGDQPVNQGPINVGYLAELVVRTAGGAENVRRLAVRFVDNVVAGDRVECTGRVVGTDPALGTADLELAAAVGDRTVLTGTATIVVAVA